MLTRLPRPLRFGWTRQITRSRDEFLSDEKLVFAHRFAAASGTQAAYEDRGLRLEVVPRSNGDRTVTITANLLGYDAPIRAEVTVLEGRATSHQVGDIRFTFFAAAHPKLLPAVEPAAPATTFVEGTYVLPPGYYFAGHSYKFEHRRFIMFQFSGVGQPSPLNGSFEIDASALSSRSAGRHAVRRLCDMTRSQRTAFLSRSSQP